MTNPSPTLAAFLSFLFPGLGQIYAGDTRKGLIWAIPMLLFIIGVLFIVLGGSAAITSFTTASKALSLVVIDVAFFLYHVAAMVDAYDVARRERSFGYARLTGGAPLALAAIVALAIVIHGIPGVFAWDYYQFAAGQTGHPLPSIKPISFAPPTPGPTLVPGASATPLVTFPPEQTSTPGGGTQTPGGPVGSAKPKVCPPPPDLSAWGPASDGRINILLVGSDSRSDTGVSDASIRTDSMLLLSVDVADCKAALFSFPRNMAEVGPGIDSRYPDWFYIPLADGSHYAGSAGGTKYLFALWQDAASSPADPRFPGSDGIGSECKEQFDCERGWNALTAAITNMSGQQIDGVISVNLKGFVDIVRNLPGGGVWLDIPQPLFDDAYYNSQQQLYPVNFSKGCQFLDAEDTLAYARSRHQDSDYERERRQQFVLQSIRKQLDPISLLPHIPGLLDAVGANLYMSFSSNDFPYLAQVASRVDADRLYQFDFAPAHLTTLGSMQGMQQKVSNIFSEPEPQPGPQQQNNCPPK